MTDLSVQHACAAALVLGPLSHYAFWIRYSFDKTSASYFTFYLLFQPVALYGLVSFAGLSLKHGILTLLTLESVYWTSTLCSIAIYRMFFHPTRQFPGPVGARLSSAWKVYTYRTRQDRPYAEIYREHEKYGNVVRVGPRNLSIRDVDAIPALFGPHSKCTRGSAFTTGNMHSLVQLSGDEHRARRKLYDQGLGPKQSQNFLPEFNRLANLFIQQMEKAQGKPIAVNPWMHYLTFDTIGQLAFGSDYGQLETGKEHPAIAAISQWFSATTFFVHLPWLANILASIPGITDPTTELRVFARDQLQQRIKEKSERPDVMSCLLKGRDADYPFAYPETYLIDDVLLLQNAGSDTTAVTLTLIFYFLCKNPKLQTQLRKEVGEATPDRKSIPNWSKLGSLPLLDAVISETLRLWPIAAQGTERETPPGAPTQVGPYLVPGETSVSVPIWSLLHDERYWDKPNEWIPERWTTRPELIKDRRAFVAFGFGTTACAGKYFAMMETKVLLAKVLTAFDFQFAPGEDGTNMINGHKDFFTMWYPDLMVQFTPRDKKGAS